VTGAAVGLSCILATKGCDQLLEKLHSTLQWLKGADRFRVLFIMKTVYEFARG